MDFAIDVEVPDENIVNRMSGRRACVGCGANLSLLNTIRQKVDGVCDACGEKISVKRR